MVVVLITAILTWNTSQELIEDTRADAATIGRILAQAALFADEVAVDVEDAIGEQMIVQATALAHLVAIAEARGVEPDEILARLHDLVDRTALDEVWITDETGHAYLNTTVVDFTFSPDPQEQPQAHVFWPLLTGERETVVQEVMRREVDDRSFKYVGVRGVDRPRIVQVGYHAEFIAQLRDRVGIARFVDDLVAGGNIIAIQVVDPGLITIAYSAVPGAPASPEIEPHDRELIQQAVATRQAQSRYDGYVMTVASPIIAHPPSSDVVGATLVRLPTEQVRQTVARSLTFGAVAALLALAAGIGAAIVLARHVTDPVAQLTDAAAAVEARRFDPASLESMAARRDELGNLARVFQHMAKEVYAREARLRQELQALRIEIDQAKKAKAVEEITATDYFQSLKAKVAQLRAAQQDEVE